MMDYSLQELQRWNLVNFGYEWNYSAVNQNTVELAYIDISRGLKKGVDIAKSP